MNRFDLPFIAAALIVGSIPSLGGMWYLAGQDGLRGFARLQTAAGRGAAIVAAAVLLLIAVNVAWILFED